MKAANEIGMALCETLGLPAEKFRSMKLYLTPGNARLTVEMDADITEEGIETVFSEYELVKAADE